MRSEPHRITSPLPPPVSHAKGDPFQAVDEEGVVHEVQTVVHPVLGRDNNIIEEDIDVTLCDYECASDWTRTAAPITCIRCVGFS
jgi:hypothetical protein